MVIAKRRFRSRDMRDGGLERCGDQGSQQPANRTIRAMTAETYALHIGAGGVESKAMEKMRRNVDTERPGSS
jgi:hypothetical protein